MNLKENKLISKLINIKWTYIFELLIW